MVNENQKFLKFIIFSQCFGQIAILSFDNGLMFNFFDDLGCGDFHLILLLKSPSFVSLLLVLPLAFLADKYGKKLIGQSGNIIQIIGLMLIASAVSFEKPLIALYLGVFIFACGSALFRCSWFALIDPLIPVSERGHFFAWMRTSWKVAAVLFTLLVQYMIGVKGTAILFELIIFVSVLSIIQLFFYQRIPEVEKPDSNPESKSFLFEMKEIIKDKDFFRFAMFKFSFPFMIGSIAILFNLYEKKYLDFSPADIMLMGNLVFIGGIVGLWAGAFLMKKLKEPQIFLICSSVITLLALLFPLSSEFSKLSSLIFAGSLTFLLGCSLTSLGIAETSLMLSLIQSKRKSLASSLCIAFTQIGLALSGLLVALLVKRDWNFDMSAGYKNIYSIILISSVLLLPLLTYHLTNRFMTRVSSK